MVENIFESVVLLVKFCFLVLSKLTIITVLEFICVLFVSYFEFVFLPVRSGDMTSSSYQLGKFLFFRPRLFTQSAVFHRNAQQILKAFFCFFSDNSLKMIKLFQWLLAVSVGLAGWLFCLFHLPDQIISKEIDPFLYLAVQYLPVLALILFGLYSLMVIGYRVGSFNDCKSDSEALKLEIDAAKKALTAKGYKF